ncbi:hypothetical protein MYX07_05525 [Patescibacteria group bacterium AH-259-L07]|nr:hypothetical protein [Patescibacteria group bacterium AH-259-L07]
MIAVILFWIGVALSVIAGLILIIVQPHSNEIKGAALALPFMYLLAAAVARYLGY